MSEQSCAAISQIRFYANVMKTRFVEAGGKSNISTELFFQPPQLSDTRHKGTTARSDKEQKQDEGANESNFFHKLRKNIFDSLIDD